jgi:hypothetical protein
MSTIVHKQPGRFSTLVGLKFFRVTSVIALLFVFGAILLPLWRLFPDIYGKPVIPLHYNVHYGVDFTGEWWQIFTLPFMGVVCVFVNSAIAMFFVRRERVLAIIALVANVVLAVLFFTATVFVVSLNLVYG